MYEQLLADAGYDPTVKLVDSRDGYMPTFPDSIDIVPEYVGGIVNFLNAAGERRDAKPFEAGDGNQLADDGADLLDERASPCSTCPRPPTPTPSSSPRSTPSPRESPSCPTSRASPSRWPLRPTARAASTARAGSAEQYGIDITEVLPLGYASDQTYKSVIDGESELGETSTTDGTLEAQGLVVLEDDKQIQPAQNLVPAVSTEFLDEHPDVADVLNPLMAALTTEKLTELNGRVAVDRETARGRRRTSWSRTACCRRR